VTGRSTSRVPCVARFISLSFEFHTVEDTDLLPAVPGERKAIRGLVRAIVGDRSQHIDILMAPKM